MKHDTSLSRVAERLEDTLFPHRRYGSAIHGATERFLGNEFSTLEAYWANPEPFEADRRKGQDAINELFRDYEANVLKHMQAIWDKEAENC